MTPSDSNRRRWRVQWYRVPLDEWVIIPTIKLVITSSALCIVGSWWRFELGLVRRLAPASEA